MLFLLQVCAFFRIWCVVELVAALLGNVPVILLVGTEDLSVYNAQNSLESEGAPIGSFQPNPAMLDTLVEMVDVDKAVASVEADRVRELGHVKKQLGVTPANFFAKGAILAANHTMRALAASREAREGVLPVLHAMATRSLDPLRALDVQHGPALLASAAIGLVEGVELLLAQVSTGAKETAGQALKLSAAAGHRKVVLTILDYLGVQGSSDMTQTTESAFLEACRFGHVSVAQVFLDRGIDTELRTSNKCLDRVEKPLPLAQSAAFWSACRGLFSRVSLTHVHHQVDAPHPRSALRQCRAGPLSAGPWRRDQCRRRRKVE